MTFYRRLGVVLAACCLLGACDAGKKNAPNAAALPEFVVHKGSKYLITQGDAELEISANIAGRISSLKIGGHEVLLTADQSTNSVWGNVLWSSPQSEWSWPPLATLDSNPYDVTAVDDRIVFTSKVDKQTGYQFIKSYGINTQKKCLSVRYSIINRSGNEKNLAAWEVTRLRPAGTVFFPQGNTDISNGIFYPFPAEHINDITWASYDPQKIHDNHHKLMTDGKEGWIAYTVNRKLLVKEFADVPVELMVAGEGEIEMFANTEKTFWEIAEQSFMTKLEPGERLDWEVLWHMRNLPAGLKVEQGSDELVNYVRGVLSGSH
jgi:hypothetical protein